MKRYIILILASIVLLIALFIYQNMRFNDGNLHLIVCDIGQGDGILIRTPNGSDILVDGGPDDSILECLNRHTPFWDRTIEMIILTHSDADHSTGIVSVIQRYSLILFITQGTFRKTDIFVKLLNLLKSKDIKINYTSLGDRLKVSDGVVFDTISPSSKDIHAVEQSDPSFKAFPVNDYGVVSILRYGKFKALLTGDVGVNIEDQIVTKIGKIDVLKVPHHGSRTGMSDYFLEQTSPNLALISDGLHNRYGHPSKIALDLLSKYGVKTLRTDQDGDLEVISDGKSYWIAKD